MIGEWEKALNKAPKAKMGLDYILSSIKKKGNNFKLNDSFKTI